MCGRYTLTVNVEQIAIQFGVADTSSIDHEPRYNIAPTQDILAVVQNSERRLVKLRWGLIPHWAKEVNSRYTMINARSETVAEKPSYSVPFEKQRCLILADGFFEWKKNGSQKTPMYIRLKSGQPFGLAGLWDTWTPKDGSSPIRSCTILTTTPNELLEPIHNRMPVILPPEVADTWLTINGTDKNELRSLLHPFPASEMEAFPVSRFVNSPANDSHQCIEPAIDETPRLL